jgi:hypothetical protein
MESQKNETNNSRMLKLVCPTKKCNHIPKKKGIKYFLKKKDTLGYGFKLALLQDQ